VLLTTYPLISSYTHNGGGTLQKSSLHLHTLEQEQSVCTANEIIHYYPFSSVEL